ncbi:MAG TPA: hypothetical protein VEW03_09945, partial [Longimicrobiaceae bacterium]|nr:hypothetical protein [Longimicrobiaceae bacterium]
MSERPATPLPGTDQPSPAPTAAAPDAIRLPGPIVGDGGDGRHRVPVTMDETPQEAMRSALLDGRTRQHPLLVVAAILPDREKALRTVLKYISDNDVEDNDLLPFARLRTVHFARFVVHEAAPTEVAPRWRNEPQVFGPDIPARLLFSTDFDGSLQAHLEELVEKVGAGLDAVFEHCAGYPAAGSRTPERVIGWIKRHRMRTNTFYTGTMNRSVLQIRREVKLHRAIDELIDREGLQATRPEDALAARARIQQFVAGHADLEWVRIPPGPSPRPILSDAQFAKLRRRPLPAILAAVAVVVGLATLGLWLAGRTPMAALVTALVALAVVGAVGYGLFRLFWSKLLKLEATDRVIIKDRWQDRARELLAREDRIVQNEMSSVIYIKEPLWFRRPLLKLVLFVIDLSARFLANTGNLAGIPSIHFARWVVVDDGRRLVFFSNFDGSWQNYLGDFIDKSAGGLTGVWSNCVGFPRNRGLTGLGARDEQKFKQYSRQSQIPTQVWYSAYKWLSVENVNNNSKIRLGLYGDMTGEQAQAWLRRFAGKPGDAPLAAAGESRPAPQPETVQLDDVQGLVVRSFAGLEHATYVPLRFAGAAGARRWVGALEPHVTRASERSGEVAAAGEAVAVAFTSDGLEALGLDEGVRRTFTLEFQEGMAWKHRKRVLGDVEEADPERWR